MSKKTVTEMDFRKPEFVGANPEDYEFRADGAIVRKDRWECGIRSIATKLTGRGRNFEIANLVKTVEWLLDQIPDSIRRCPLCESPIADDTEICMRCQEEC